MSARYAIPAERVRVEDQVKQSRFITTLGHASTAEDARAFIDAVRGEFGDATHNCWAFVAGPPGSLGDAASSDDGEPGATAGRPMLAVLLGAGVGEVVVVVTRYYGGVKLGRGGLVRAYSGAVRHALRELPLAEHVARSRLRIELPYPMVGAVKRWCDRLDVITEEAAFADLATMVVSVPTTRLDEFVAAVREATSGQARISPA